MHGDEIGCHAKNAESSSRAAVLASGRTVGVAYALALDCSG